LSIPVSWLEGREEWDEIRRGSWVFRGQSPQINVYSAYYYCTLEKNLR
jgi:hypothetical protein